MVWLVLFVASLFILPGAIPPTRQPSYTVAPLSLGNHWILGGSPSGSGPTPRLYVNVTRTVTGRNGTAAEVSLSYQGTPAGAAPWPWTNLTYEDPTGLYTSLGLACPSGNGTLRPSEPIPLGLTFPLAGGGSSLLATNGTLTGSCGNGPVEVVVEGNYTAEPPPGGSRCALYLCDLAWSYPCAYTLQGMSPGGALLWSASFQGVYVPSQSGFQSVRASSPLGRFNATLAVSSASGTPPNPPLWIQLLESAGVVLFVPVLAVLLEALRFRGRLRREEERDREVLRELVTSGSEDPFAEPLEELPPPADRDPGPGELPK